MRKQNVVTMLMCFGLAAIVAWPALAHEPIGDLTECLPIGTAFDEFPDPEGEGDCYDYEPEGEQPWEPAGYCQAIWPTASAYAPIITWQLDIELEWYDYGMDFVAIHDGYYIQGEGEPVWVNYPVDLPPTYDFCAWMDQLYCSLEPFFSLLPELETYGYMLSCGVADVNGVLDECFDLPMQGNGIPDRYELAVLAAVLNDSAHPLHADAITAFEYNANWLAHNIIEAFRDIDGMDVRGISYGMSIYTMPALAGLLAAFGAIGDPQTNVVLTELLRLFEDLGVEVPEGGAEAVLQSVQVGPTYDVNGNGYTGREIYEWFIQTMDPPMTMADYASLVLDPGAPTPPAKAVVLGGGNFAHDVTEITLTANVTIDFGQVMDYQWYEWGVVDVAPADPNDPFGVECDVYGWIPIVDETGSQLVLTILDAPFEGRYAVDVGMSTEDPVKATREGGILASADVTKDAEPPVPVSGSFALALFAGVCALAGAAGIRRRK